MTSRISDVAGSPGFKRIYDEDDDRTVWITLADRIALDDLQKIEISTDDLVICRDVALNDTTAANVALQYRLRVI